MAERETLKKPDGRRLSLKEVMTEKSVRVLRRAMMNFVVGAAVRRLQQQKAAEPPQKYSLLLHTEQSRDAHSWQETVATALRDQFEKAAANNDSAFQQLFSESYRDIENSVSVASLWMPTADETGDNVRSALTSGFLQITKVNSDRA